MRSAYETPTEKCPYCGSDCDADWADVGVGMVQCGPYHCMNCLASEIGPYDKPRELTAKEKETGWYAPGEEPGSSANVIGGKIVTHQEMQSAYRNEFMNNPMYEVDGAVEKWREDIRKPNVAERD